MPLSLLLGARMASSTQAVATSSASGVLAMEARQAPATPRLRPLLLAIAGVATASYFYGPPWGARPLGGPIDYHETVHFTALQALRLGGLPYIGAASDQYGPGSQLFIYGWMKLIGGFDLSGFREAYAAQHWLAVAFVCVLVLLVLPRRAALPLARPRDTGVPDVPALRVRFRRVHRVLRLGQRGTLLRAPPSRLGATPLATHRPSQPAPCSGRSGSHGGSPVWSGRKAFSAACSSPAP